MPTMAQLGELASQLYVGNPSIGAYENKSNIQFDSNSSTAKSLGLTPTFYLWSGEEDCSHGACYRSFGTTYLYLWSGEASSSRIAYSRRFYTDCSYWYTTNRGNTSNQAVCLGE